MDMKSVKLNRAFSHIHSNTRFKYSHLKYTCFKESGFVFFPFIVSVCCFLLVLFSLFWIQQIELKTLEQSRQVVAQKRINDIATFISSSMKVRLNLTNSLSAFVQKNKSFSHQDYQQFTGLLLNGLSGVISLQLAPNGIVTYITDPQKNKKTLGHNLLTDPNRRELALKSIQENRFIITGPVDLIQGGEAIIARQPIFLPFSHNQQSSFWGFAIVIIDLPALLKDTLILNLQKDYQVAIRGRHGLGAQGELFFGEQLVFDKAIAKASILLPNAQWQLAVLEKRNEPLNGFFESKLYWFLSALIAVIVGLISYSISDRPRKQQQNINEATTALRNEVKYRKLVEEKLQLSSRVFSDTHEGIIITDANQNIIDVNPAFTKITGYCRKEIIGKKPTLLKSGKQTAMFYAEMWQVIKDHGFWQGEIWNKDKQGNLYAELLIISSLTNDNNEVTHYVGVFSDITRSKRQQDQLKRMVHYDILTNLPNRALFVDRFQQSIAHSERTGNQLAVCFLDLDNFKPINDNYGHDIGDRILIEVAKRITQCIREEDTVSRQGGDEFAILLNDIKSASQYECTMNRIHNTLAQPYIIDNIKHNITASSGVTLYPSDKGDIDTLLRHADHAMYQSKLSGKNRSQLYSPDSDLLIIQKNLQLEEIQQALTNDEFQLYYQPKVNMVTGNVFGVEALIRWIHPDKGVIPPLDFLPLIDGTHLEVKVGEWVINKAINQLNIWHQQNIMLEVSVNISSNHLLSTSFIEVLEQCLTQFKAINPKKLQLEILESSALGDIDTINQIIKQCQNRLGVSFALDDFGTGYSSLTHLRSLPVNMIKIDQSFVRDMLEDPSDYSIIEGVIALTQSFNRHVIAEGVETTNHGLMLMLLGCEHAQGYAIAKPMPISTLTLWLSIQTPNQQWLDCGNQQRNNKEKSLAIFIMICELWKDKFKQKLLSPYNPVIFWPILDSETCQCSSWIRRNKQEQLFKKECLQQLENIHEQLHNIANKIYITFQQGGQQIDGSGKQHSSQYSSEHRSQRSNAEVCHIANQDFDLTYQALLNAVTLCK